MDSSPFPFRSKILNLPKTLTARNQMEKRVHVTLSGMVQGIGFRWFVHQRATALKLRGFVRNVPDGRVELEAEGNAAQVEALLREVRLGPAGSSVQGVKVEECTVTFAESGFVIRA